MKRGAGWSAVLAGLAVAIGGCRSGRVGTSTFEVIPSRPSMFPAPRQVDAEPTTELHVDYIAVRPRRELVKPEYPLEALTARAGNQVVDVTIAVDEHGRVTAVNPTPAWSLLPGPFAEAFLGAVRAAVATWELEPARQVYWRRVGQEDRYLRTETIAEEIELRFHFTADHPAIVR